MTLLVNLKRILHDLGEDIVAQGEIEMETLTVGDVSFRFAHPACYSVTFTNTGGGIVASGVIEGTAITECSRCLSDFELPMHGEVESFYVTPDKVESLPAEQEFELVQDEKVDLAPALLAALAVEAPFAPLHAEDCAGICPLCGCDRNVETCDCKEAPAGSPFDVLKGMFGETPDEGGDGGSEGSAEE